MEQVKYNETMINAVKNYLGQRLGTYGVLNYELKFDNPASIDLIQELPLNRLGIFAHALRHCFLEVEFHKLQFGERELHQNWTVRCSLSYESLRGGTNGLDLSLKFYVNEKGDITEIYK